jgi:hypothetical protein
MKGAVARGSTRNPFKLDPAKPVAPQIISTLGQSTVIFGGPLLGLSAINNYPFLIRDRTIYLGGIAGIVAFFLTSFLVFRHDDFLLGLPLVLRLMVRLGWGLGSTSLLLGITGISNGYGTPLKVRRAPVVAKHQTLQRDPGQRTYYVAVRPWPDSPTVVELSAPQSTYDRLDVPLDAIDTPQDTLNAMPDVGQVLLIVGNGRLGLEWLNRMDPL